MLVLKAAEAAVAEWFVTETVSKVKNRFISNTCHSCGCRNLLWQNEGTPELRFASSGMTLNN